jgi:hypothetical protein
MKMEAVYSSDMLVSTHHTTWCYKPKDQNMHGDIRLSVAEDEKSENIYDMKTTDCNVCLSEDYVCK